MATDEAEVNNNPYNRVPSEWHRKQYRFRLPPKRFRVTGFTSEGTELGAVTVTVRETDSYAAGVARDEGSRILRWQYGDAFYRASAAKLDEAAS